MLVRSPIFPSSAKVKKIALVQPKRNLISKNSRIQKRKAKPLPDLKNPIDFFRKKNPDQSSRSKSSCCYVCKKKGYFTRNCPNQLIEHLQSSKLLSESDDVESFFSEQEDYDEQTTFVLAETEDHSNPENVFVIQTMQQIQKVQSVIPIPSIKIQLLPEKFDKPVPIIGFVDTGAQTSMLNPSILPSQFWEKHTEYFKAANGELFHRSLITKKTHWYSILSRMCSLDQACWIQSS